MIFMEKRWLFGLILLVLVLMSHFSFAHSRFNPTGNVPGRSDEAGLKTGTCGGVARTATPKVVASGSQLRVDWQETINHPGYFEFYFSSAGDANFIKLATVNDNQNGSADLPHNFSTMLTMPNGNCTGCTLQMIQVMTEVPASPSFYYSCADIELSTTAAPAPTTPLPTPSPSPEPPSPTDAGHCH
jgi:hypothetical protein